MAEKEQHSTCQPSAKAIEKAQQAIAFIAVRDGVSIETVRAHIQSAIIGGLAAEDPDIQAAWARIPKAGDVPTPEEVIAYGAGRVGETMGQGG